MESGQTPPPPVEGTEPPAADVAESDSVAVDGTEPAEPNVPDVEPKEDLSHLPDAERLGLDYTVTSVIIVEYDGEMVEDQ